MASNPKWRQPLRKWKEYFSDWVRAESPEAMLFSLIFFDFRPVYGKSGLGQRLREHLDTCLREEQNFFVNMASFVVRSAPPLGLFGALKLEKNGKHRNTLNVKEQGLALVVDAARLFALEMGVHSTSTLERLEELRGRHLLADRFGRELEEAFEFLMSLRLKHQLSLMQENREPDNFIDPQHLSTFERKTLKETFKLMKKMHDGIIEKYKPLILAKL